MFKLNHNFIVSGFVLVGLLAFGAMFILPSNAFAYKVDGSYKYTDDLDYTYNTRAPRNAIPLIYSISPNYAYSNAKDRTINIEGSRFFSSSVARFDGQNRATTYVDQEHLIVELNANDFKVPGDHFITVYTPNYGGGISNEAIFSVVRVYPNGAGTTFSNGNGSVNGANVNNGNSGNNSSNTDTSDDTSNLGASAIGSGFMPSSFLGWLMLVLILIVIVMLFRKLYITEKDKKAPLKHA